MFVAMNRFKVARGSEAAFETLWRDRESFLRDAPGFKAFHLLKGGEGEGPEGAFALYASHSVWASRAAFEEWTRSEAFRAAHANAGGSRDMYLGPPVLELFETVDGTAAAGAA